VSDLGFEDARSFESISFATPCEYTSITIRSYMGLAEEATALRLISEILIELKIAVKR